MSDDIVARLRRNPLYIPTSRINSFGRPQMGFELTSFNIIAADEIERLRNELAACCRSAAPGPHTTGGGDPSAAEELEAWRAAFRREDEFDGRCE